MNSEDARTINGEVYLSARGVLELVENCPVDFIKPGPMRDWIIDFQRRRPAMSEAAAMREVLERIGCGDTMPKPRGI